MDFIPTKVTTLFFRVVGLFPIIQKKNSLGAFISENINNRKKTTPPGRNEQKKNNIPLENPGKGPGKGKGTMESGSSEGFPLKSSVKQLLRSVSGADCC